MFVPQQFSNCKFEASLFKTGMQLNIQLFIDRLLVRVGMESDL